MKKKMLFCAVLFVMATCVQAGLNAVPLLNPSFEATTGTDEVSIIDWWDSKSYTKTVAGDGVLVPETPYGDNWGQLGNGRWMYQQIGTYEENMVLDISFLLGQGSDKIVAGLEVELFAGGDASLADNVGTKRDNTAFPLDSVVGAVQIATSGNIDPFTDPDTAIVMRTQEMSIQLSTGTVGTGYVVGDPLWLLFSRPSETGKANIDNVAVTVVPEPATMALLGFGSIVAFRRRRK